MTYPTTGDLVRDLQKRRVSAIELLDRVVARIEAIDETINAVVVRDFERARAAAAKADEALARGERRPLLGVPITVKEAFNVAGLPTTWGIPGTGQTPVNADAVAVARLKEAGAIVVGKTNVALQLADWQSFNPVYGTTNNPWDAARTAGGSSGGSAAALAAGYVSLEFGSDLASSLRNPASFCGVFAHKPSWGLVPLRGFAPPGTPQLSVSPDVDLAVIGPMARSASDVALALAVTAGPDDDKAVGYRLALPQPRHELLKDYRVLVLNEHPLLPTASNVCVAISRIAVGLRKVGCKVARSSSLLPDLALTCRTFGQLLMALFSSDTRHRDWLEADRTRAEIAHQWRQLFKEWDVVLCPAAPTTAFKHDHGEMNARKLTIDGRAIPYTDQSLWGPLATLTGLPATVMPIGLDKDGLPVGMQILGAYLEDRTTIAFAKLAEREFGGFVPPKGLDEHR